MRLRLTSPTRETEAFSLACPFGTVKVTSVTYPPALVSDSFALSITVYGDRVRLDRPTVTLLAPSLVSVSVKCWVELTGPTALSCVGLARMACPDALALWYERAASTAW